MGVGRAGHAGAGREPHSTTGRPPVQDRRDRFRAPGVTIGFVVHADSLSGPLPFSFEFQANYDIEAVAFGYDFMMKG